MKVYAVLMKYKEAAKKDGEFNHEGFQGDTFDITDGRYGYKREENEFGEETG